VSKITLGLTKPSGEPMMKTIFGKDICMIKLQGVFRVLTVLGALLALALVPAGASTGGKIAGVVTDARTGDALKISMKILKKSH
jgi:hypothetical protein